MLTYIWPAVFTVGLMYTNYLANWSHGFVEFSEIVESRTAESGILEVSEHVIW